MQTHIIQSLIFISSSILFTNLFIQWFSRLSQHVGLVDQPNARKIHQHSVPLIGGISITSGLFFAVLLSPIIRNLVSLYSFSFTAVFIIFIMSLVDDRFDISAKIRLGIQVTAAIAVAASGVRIESMYGLFGIHDIPSQMQYVITILVLVGSTNAFNLIDGVDGLAGSLGLITTLVFAFISFSLQDFGMFLFCIGLAVSLVVFLKYNLNPAKIFMGDAGSMTLGFLLTMIGIILLQSASHSEHVSLIFILVSCVLLVPVIDALRVFMKRYSKGSSILEADKTHLHHLLLHSKGNHKRVVISIIVLQIALLSIAILLSFILSISVIVSLLIISQIIISKILMINQRLDQWQDQLHKHEKLQQF